MVSNSTYIHTYILGGCSLGLLGCRGFNKRKAADTREDCGGISGENLGSDLSPPGPEAQWTAATTPPTDASRAHAAVKVAALLLRGGGERSPPQGASVDVDALFLEQT